MGNTSTKEKADHVDGGALLPHGVYSGPQDYDFRIVQRLILQRKLAPFYKGLEDWDDNEDALEEKAKQLKTAAAPSAASSGARQGHARTTSTQSQTRANHMTEAERDMRRLYQGAIECPICFLYYPRNINRTRCCDKPMCTECFVQLKRSESAPAESPACPYCVEPHFGVIYSSSLVPSGLLSSPTSTAFQS
ncbi:SNF1-interacting protein, partial [Mortierella sp. NVP85]